MSTEWTVLSDEAQLALAAGAMQRALSLVSQHAERLAAEIEDGSLSDQGGAEALRLLTALIRLDEAGTCQGNA